MDLAEGLQFHDRSWSALNPSLMGCMNGVATAGFAGAAGSGVGLDIGLGSSNEMVSRRWSSLHTCGSLWTNVCWRPRRWTQCVHFNTVSVVLKVDTSMLFKGSFGTPKRSRSKALVNKA